MIHLFLSSKCILLSALNMILIKVNLLSLSPNLPGPCSCYFIFSFPWLMRVYFLPHLFASSSLHLLYYVSFHRVTSEKNVSIQLHIQSYSASESRLRSQWMSLLTGNSIQIRYLFRTQLFLCVTCLFLFLFSSHKIDLIPLSLSSTSFPFYFFPPTDQIGKEEIRELLCYHYLSLFLYSSLSPSISFLFEGMVKSSFPRIWMRKKSSCRGEIVYPTFHS